MGTNTIKEFLSQLDDLAMFAERVLMEGGLFVTYCGQYYFDRYIQAFGNHLNWRWMLSQTWDGDANKIFPLNVISQWKPIVVYSKGMWDKCPQWPDVLRVNRKEKTEHPWQQTLEEAERLLRYFSEQHNLVVDPCGGSFTTAVASLKLNRRCISCDCEEEAVATGHRRLKEEWERNES